MISRTTISVHRREDDIKCFPNASECVSVFFDGDKIRIKVRIRVDDGFDTVVVISEVFMVTVMVLTAVMM